jgi:hypothetical protein
MDTHVVIALTGYLMWGLWVFALIGFMVWTRGLRSSRTTVPVDGTVVAPAEQAIPPDDPSLALPILAERTRRRKAARADIPRSAGLDRAPSQ